MNPGSEVDMGGHGKRPRPDISMEESHEAVLGPPAKKSREFLPWSPAEEQRLKNMRDAGYSWGEISKVWVSRITLIRLEAFCEHSANMAIHVTDLSTKD